MNQNSNKNISTREIITTVGYIMYNLLLANICLGVGLYTVIMMFDGDMTPLEPLMVILLLASAVVSMILAIISLSRREKLNRLKFKLIYQILADKQSKFLIFFLTWMAWAVNNYGFDHWFKEYLIGIWWLYGIFIIAMVINKKMFRKTFKEIKEVVGDGN